MSTEVVIFMGSDSDYGIMEEAVKILKEFGVSHDVIVSSAHRTPARTRRLVAAAEKKGVQAFIVGAGAAAHLAGVIAAESIVPVIGVPIDATPLRGVDALYATVQMPGGIPVATMAIGKAGAKNAGLFAVSTMATKNPKLKEKLKTYRKNMVKSVEEKNKKLQTRIKEKK